MCGSTGPVSAASSRRCRSRRSDGLWRNAASTTSIAHAPPMCAGFMGANIKDLALYHLVIDSTFVPLGDAADLIVRAVRASLAAR